ncbi:response regulator [Desulfonatronovibrio magnus]|uniref:response regulator n=1 Tax=Desulfonatronovibrio magnus TaxID=698827 RepID=UPI0005EB0D47|nr:response regulator [Desulfonatronovibrio magnus]
MKALIVEDDLTSRMLLEKILSPFFQCHSVENGLEAVNIFREAHENQAPYDLLALDIMMPIMDGHSALMAIREIESKLQVPPGQEIKVVMTTSLSDSKSITEAFSSGQADGYITKPFSKNKVLEVLQDLHLLELP